MPHRGTTTICPHRGPFAAVWAVQICTTAVNAITGAPGTAYLVNKRFSSRLKGVTDETLQMTVAAVLSLSGQQVACLPVPFVAFQLSVVQPSAGEGGEHHSKEDAGLSIRLWLELAAGFRQPGCWQPQFAQSWPQSVRVQ